jgi:hypothetical protein
MSLVRAIAARLAEILYLTGLGPSRLHRISRPAAHEIEVTDGPKAPA